MGLPYWDRLRRQYRRQREQTPRRCRAPLVFFLLAWFAAQAPAGEAAPVRPSQQNVEPPANSAYTGATWFEKAAAEVSRLGSILKARLLHPDLLQINNEVVLPGTAVAIMVYTVAAICMLIRIRSDGKRLLHASVTREGRGAKIPYVISILTGYMPGAGTTAEVLLRIVGTDDVSPYVNISRVAKSMGLPNPVRRGEHTTLTLWVPDSLGPVETVEIKLHKCTEKTAWLLKYVKLTDPLVRLQYYACVDNWVQGTATHSYCLRLPCFVSRWRQLQISFKRAFSRLFIWSFWSGSRVSSMSSFASLSLCSLLVLSVMSACAVYLYIITQEMQVFQAGAFRPEDQSMTALLIMLEPEHLLVLLELIVTIAAIGWTLEVLIRCVKKAKAKYRSVQKLPQPKGKQAKKLHHHKACGTEKPINSGLQKQPKNNVCKQKNDIDIHKMLENRVKDLLHNRCAYIKYSTSTANQSDKSAQSQEGLNRKASCAICKSKEKIMRERARIALGGKTSKMIKSTAKDMVQTVMSEMPPSKDSFPKLYKTISDSITKMFSDGKLIEKKSYMLVNELGNNSDIVLSRATTNKAETSQQQPSPPGSVLHKLINVTIKDSVTESVGYALGQMQESTVTDCNHEINNEKESKIKKESGHSFEKKKSTNTSGLSIDKKESSKQLKREALMNKVSFSELKEEEVKTALSASMEAVTLPFQPATTKKAVNKAMKKAAVATAGKVLDVMVEVLQEPLLNGPKEVAEREVRRKVEHVIADQYSTLSFTKKELEIFAHVRQYVETLTTNASIQAKFLLSQGRGVQPDDIVNTVSGQVMHQLAQVGSSTVNMKRALRCENFQNQVVNAAVQKAVADLDTQLSANEKKQVACCCDITDRLRHEALEEIFHNPGPQRVVARLAEELVQELTQQACDHVGQQLLEMNKDSSLVAMAEGCLLNPAAFGFLPSSDPMVQVDPDVCTKVLPKALLQTKEEMDKNACNNTSACEWSLMHGDLGLGNHNANNTYHYPINGEGVDFSHGSLYAGATHWSELQLNQNHTVIDVDQKDTVIDMDQKDTVNDMDQNDWSVLSRATRPPFPVKVDGALLDLEESLARPALGCLPSAFIYLVYLLLLLLGAVLVASLVLYGGALPSVLTLTWLVYVMVGLALHMLVLEPLKVLLVLACTGTLA